MEQRKTTIGGQALIEGIVMRGKNSAALAVRLPNGQIDIEEKTLKPIRDNNSINTLELEKNIKFLVCQ